MSLENLENKLLSELTINQKRFGLFAFGFFQFVVILAGISPGTDISQARNSFLSGENSDFLGIFAGWAYSLLPNGLIPWEISLATIQMVSVICAFQVELHKRYCDKRGFIFYVIFQYAALEFSAQQSRDGTLFAFLCLGLSFLRLTKRLNNKKTAVYVLYLSLALILIGLTFRPWMIPVAIVLIIFEIRGNRQETVLKNRHQWVFLLSIIFIPFSIEEGLSKILQTKETYPLQILLIHDLVSASCWSANLRTSEESILALKPLSNNPKFATNLCQFFRPNTWQAVIGGASGSLLTDNFEPPISITTNKIIYNGLFKSWLRIFINDPKTYLQNKLMLSSQVFFASQTNIELSIFTPENVKINKYFSTSYEVIHRLVHLPWIIMSGLYLLTPGMMMIIYVLFFSRFIRSRVPMTSFWLIPTMALVCIGWGTLTFVSDNARYLTSFVILTYFSIYSLNQRNKIGSNC